MMSNIKEETLKVEVTSEDNLENAFLPENKHSVGDCIDFMVENYSRFKVKKEFEFINYDELNTDSLKQDSAIYFKCKEEINEEGPSEICNKLKTEIQQNVPKNNEADEKIDISQINLQSNNYNDDNFKYKSENNSENQKAFSQSPDNDPLKQSKEKKHRNHSIHTKKAKRKNCLFCNKSLATKQLLEDHMLKQHKQEMKGDLKSLITNKIHTCKMCNSYETTHKWHLDQHINSVHNEVKIKINCQFCTESFIFKRSLDEHVLRKHKDIIKNDIKSFITRKIHLCKICNSFESTNKSIFDKHISSAHSKVKIVKIYCQFCTKSFLGKRSLDEHVLRIHKDDIKIDIKSFITRKIHICKICNSFETTYKWTLDKHINSVHNEVKIKIKCQFCTESFVCKHSLDGHLLNNHKDNIKHDIKSFITNKIHVCQLCNTFETTHKWILDKHINSIHNKVKIKMKCPFCTESFILKQSLDEHVLKKHKDKIKNDINSFITNKIRVCKICNSFETTQKWILDKHVNSVHNKVKIKKKCQFCTESFMLKQSLDEHLLRKHKDNIKHDIKSFMRRTIHVCKICNSFETIHKSTFDKHINSAHNNVKTEMKY